MSEEKKVFDKKFVHFMWADELKGKEGFYADTIDNLINHVERKDDDFYGKIECKSSSLPFRIRDGAHWRFFYHDPLYEIKWAWKQGKQIQSRSKVCICDGWRDDDYPNWNNSCEEFRVKPEKKWRPFNDIAELKQAWSAKRSPLVHPELEEHTIWVRSKANSACTRMLNGFIDESNVEEQAVSIGTVWNTMDMLFKGWEFLDGTPCGVEEE